MKPGKIKTDTYNTVLVICIGLMIIYAVNKQKWEMNAAIIIGILSILSKSIATLISYCWMKLAEVLGLIVPNILLSVIFFLVLTPIAFFSRIFSKKDPLGLKDTTASTFKTVTTRFDADYFQNPW